MEFCTACELWRIAAKESGYADGMCEDCFNKQFVKVHLHYDPHKVNISIPEVSKNKDKT